MLAGLDFATLQFRLNQLLQIFLEGVVIFLRFPLRRQRFDELMGNLDFGVFNLHVGRAEGIDRANFLGGSDNITAVLASVEEGDPAPPPPAGG